MKKLHNQAAVHCSGSFHIIEVNLGEVINLIFLIEKSERFIIDGHAEIMMTLQD